MIRLRSVYTFYFSDVLVYRYNKILYNFIIIFLHCFNDCVYQTYVSESCRVIRERFNLTLLNELKREII